MKRCPTCNQTFEEEWLSFCTNDGTGLVETEASPREPPPTIRIESPDTSPSGKPTFDLPGSYNPPPAQFVPPQPATLPWQPPAPPAHRAAPQQGLAIASLVLGLCSITFGWCCSLGLVTAPVAIVMGIVSLVQIKNDPSKHTGKPPAIIGIATGGAYLVFWVLLVLLYGFAIFMGNLK